MISRESAPRTSDAPAPTRRGALVAVVRADAMESEPRSLVRNLEFSTAIVACTSDPRLASALRQAGVDHVIEGSAADRTRSRPAASGLARGPWPAALRTILDEFGPQTWILSTDGDERVSAELCEALASLPADDREKIHAYRVPVTRFVCGAYLRYGGWASRELRIFRLAAPDQVAPTEPESGTGDFDAPIVHLGHRRIDERLRWINARTDLIDGEATESPGVLATLTAPLARFIDIYGMKRGYRDGIPGLVAAALAAFETFLRGLKRWERCHRPKGE